VAVLQCVLYVDAVPVAPFVASCLVLYYSWVVVLRVSLSLKTITLSVGVGNMLIRVHVLFRCSSSQELAAETAKAEAEPASKVCRLTCAVSFFFVLFSFHFLFG
jgi:hypothetical protein